MYVCNLACKNKMYIVSDDTFTFHTIMERIPMVWSLVAITTPGYSKVI